MRQNPPGPDDQVIYKLGSIEAEVRGLVTKIDDFVTAVDKKVDGHGEALKTEISRLERRIKHLEDWRQMLFTKLGFVISGVSVFWLVFGEALKKTMDTALG